MSQRAVVYLTQNFDRNMAAIERFVEQADLFDALVDEMFTKVIPNLEDYPEMGRDFLGHAAGSREGRARCNELRRRLGEGARLREYILDQYLVLYALRGRDIFLLAIKHHRQLSFDLRGHWT